MTHNYRSFCDYFDETNLTLFKASDGIVENFHHYSLKG